MPEVADFDYNGLWRHQGAFFSKHGNFKQTIVRLITDSAQGLSSAELGKLLGLQPRSFLSHFREHPEIYREKLMRRWIWFAANPKIHKKQKQTRLAWDVAKEPRMPTDGKAVMILVDLIQHPNSNLEQVARRLKPKGHNIDADAIRQLLVHHDLLKKPWIFPYPMFKALFGETAKQSVAGCPVSEKALDTVCSQSELLSTMPSCHPCVENPHTQGRHVVYRTFRRP